MSNILLVRSPQELLSENLAGYGWPQVNLSAFEDVQDLMSEFESRRIDLGRQRNQIKRFFNIKAGDIIVVPLHRSIAIGIATGRKSYSKSIPYGENRIGVEYFKDTNGKVLRISRKELPEMLSTRLRIRMSVVYLNEFSSEIERIVGQVERGGAVSFDSQVEELQRAAEVSFKQKLLDNIQSGKSNLESGGLGLERLVLELIKLEGYSGKILAKNSYDGVADADIEAFRLDRFTSTKLLIQVKHYKGNTGSLGIKQLSAVEDDEDIQRWLITSGSMRKELREQAADHQVFIMDGEDLIEWIFEHWQNLSAAARNKLGISDVPTILL